MVSMQDNSGEDANHFFGTMDLSTEHGEPEPTSPTRRDSEHHHGSRPSPGHGTTQRPSKKTEDRPIHRSRATPSGGDTHTSDRTSVKLRNSCRSCADSKVKCDRAKPRCSRCDTRDLPCEYLQSKRPGRIPGASLRQKQEQQAAKQSSHGRDSTAQAGNTQFNNSRDPTSAITPLRLEDFPFDWSQRHTPTPVRGSSFGSHVDGNTAASSPSRGDAELGGFYACNAPVAPMATLTADSSMEDARDFVAMDSGGGDPGVSYAFNAPIDPMSIATTKSAMDDTLHLLGMDAFWPIDYGDFVDLDPANFANVSASPHAPHLTAFTMSSHSGSDVPSLTSSSSHSNFQELLGISASSPGTSHDAIAGPSSNSGSTSCTCMMRALEMLKILSSNESPDASSGSSERQTQQVLLNNKEAIDASLVVLACGSCSNDRFLLMILLMTAAKILTRYASAAALCRTCASSNMPEASSSVAQTSSLSNHTSQLMEIPQAWSGASVLPPAHKASCANQMSCREAVQRVLRELHLVQRLLVRLALRRESLCGGNISRAGAAGLTDNFPGGLVMRDRSGSQIGSRSGSPPGGGAPALLTPHLHDNALGLVEDDVRNGLGVLSTAIRNVLNSS